MWACQTVTWWISSGWGQQVQRSRILLTMSAKPTNPIQGDVFCVTHCLSQLSENQLDRGTFCQQQKKVNVKAIPCFFGSSLVRGRQGCNKADSLIKVTSTGETFQQIKVGLGAMQSAQGAVGIGKPTTGLKKSLLELEPMVKLISCLLVMIREPFFWIIIPAVCQSLSGCSAGCFVVFLFTHPIQCNWLFAHACSCTTQRSSASPCSCCVTALFNRKLSGN